MPITGGCLEGRPAAAADADNMVGRRRRWQAAAAAVVEGMPAVECCNVAVLRGMVLLVLLYTAVQCGGAELLEGQRPSKGRWAVVEGGWRGSVIECWMADTVGTA